MNLNDKLNVLTTPVLTGTPHGQAQGTAFYYQHLSPKTEDGPEWRKVVNTWLVTNRHVVLPQFEGKEATPTSLAFHLRRAGSTRLRWETFTLPQDELLKRVKLHPDNEVDVAIIDIGDLLLEKLKTDRQTETLMAWSSVGPEDFSGENKISVEVADDVLVIGYPRGFYDHVNLYPIVKGGIVASRWGAHFAGKPYFLIDAKLFPGSSGSIVVSKPRDFIMDSGRIYYAKEKQFAFLGVFSGEFRRQGPSVELDDLIIVQKSGYDVGIVWYASLVEEIVDKGLPLSPPEAVATRTNG